MAQKISAYECDLVFFCNIFLSFIRFKIIGGKIMAKDLVCGMDVDAQEAESKGLVTEYKGTKYYFCAPGCKRHFEKDPEKWLN